jgi:lipopolysaccharide assembly outer membrane protein LptD (OstA)
LKLLRYIILLKSIVLLTVAGNDAFAFSHLSMMQVLQQQDTAGTDTTKKPVKSSSGLDDKVETFARDSTKYSKDRSIMYLYGNARVIYQSFELDAEFIRYDSKNSTIFASGLKDAKGRYTGRPIFKMEAEGSSVADSLLYNTKTGKGTVYNTFTEQEGGFFSGGQSKKQPDDEIHIKGMTYSTCNLPHPHFGIYITKGIVAERQIITGPVYLKIEDIPIPVGLPFAFFPKPNRKSSGIILPSFGEDATRGFFLRDAGYYLGISDYVDARIMGTIYTRGSYETNLASNYLKRYKYNGNLNLAYASTRLGLEGTPEYEPQKNFHINWTHSQNPNAHPGTVFSASVNAGTSSYNATTAAGGTYDVRAISQNTLASSISYGKTAGIFNLTAALSHSQEIQSKTISLTLPQVSLNMNTINPFDSKDRVGDQKWYQKLTVGYSMQASNTVSTTEDLLFQPGGFKRFQNGFNHSIPLSLPFNVAKYFNFNANAQYTEQWHFQTVDQKMLKMINRPDSLVYDTISGFKRSGEYNIGIGVSTKIYNTAQFKNLGKLAALRHVMTPSANLSYAPDFSKLSKGYYKELAYQDGSPVSDPNFPGRQRRYSIFERTLYSGPGQGQQATLGFSLDNTVEAKIRSDKDTTGSGFRKLAIIQGLRIGGSYNFLAPAYKLSVLSFSGRSQFTDKIGINYSGSLNPYATKDTVVNNQITKTLVDRYTWQNAKLPRLTNFGFSFDYSLNPESFKRRNENVDQLKEQNNQSGMTAEQAAQLNAISRDPNAFVDFNIPWNFAFAYSFQYATTQEGTRPTYTNTLTFNGDLNVTPKWKVQFTSGYDFQAKDVSLTNIAIYRDLHCWDMSINWVPFGLYRSYSVTLKVKASILQDLKLSKQRSYQTRYE